MQRLSAKKTLYEKVEETAEDDYQSAADEASIEELTNVAVEELLIKHPMSYDGCAKLKNCFVSVLMDICLFCLFCTTGDTDITIHLKQSCVKKIQSFLSWVCQQQDS